MHILRAAVAFTALLIAPAFAQSAMPGQTTVASTMLHQVQVPHTAVLPHLPQQNVVPQTSMPGDRAGYTPFYRSPAYHYPAPAPHEAQPQL